MAVRIEYITQFGDETVFNFPTGLIADNNYLFIADRQNNKIQIRDYDFGLITDFANADAILPEDICELDGFYYVSDSANSQILKYNQSLDFISAFQLDIDYPSGICSGSDSIFVIAENKVIELETDGTERSRFGVYGTTAQAFNFPYSIEYNQGNLYITDSSNQAIKVYSESSNFISSKTVIGFEYPSGIVYAEGVYCVTDANAHKIFIFDNNLTLIQTVETPPMFFPKGIAVGGGFMFVADSGNNQIIKYSFEVLSELRFEEKFTGVLKSLYPTGRIFRMAKDSVISKVHQAFAMSFSRFFSRAVGLQDYIFPDNDGFDAQAIEEWERVYGIVSRGTIQDRYKTLQQLFSYPNNKTARLSAQFIQEQLRNAGFDVYVTYNRFPAPTTNDTNFGTFNFGTQNFGSSFSNQNRFERREPEFGYTEYCANYIDPTKDADIFNQKQGTNFGTANLGTFNFETAEAVDREIQLRGTFFVHGETYPDIADVPLERKNEFRNMILKLKLASLVGILYVNYV